MDQAQGQGPGRAAAAIWRRTRWWSSCRPALRRRRATLAEVANPAMRASPSVCRPVPVGRYTKGVLEAAKLWSTIEPKMIGASSVRRRSTTWRAPRSMPASSRHRRGHHARQGEGRLHGADHQAHPSTRSPRWQGAPEPGEAAKFLDFLFTPPAQAVLAKYGFGKP